jgi:hypothetical protein
MQKHIIYFISQDFVQINKNKNDGIDEDVWLVPSLDIIGEENACFGLFFASLLIITNNWFKKNYIFRKEKTIVLN